MDIIKLMFGPAPQNSEYLNHQPRGRLFKAILLMLGLVMVLSQPLSVLAQGAKKMRLITDSETENFIKTIASPLFLAARLDPQSVQIILIEDDKLNAFVAGGQNIFLHTGLIMQSDSPEALMGVLAHETGHIEGGHLIRTRNAIENAKLIGTISALLGTAAAIGSGRGDIASAAILGGQGMATRNFMKFSRTQESSADQTAFRLLDATGYSAKGLENFLGKIKDQDLMSPRFQDPYMRTHPLSNDRLAAIRNHIEKSPNSNARVETHVVENFKLIKAKLYGFLKPFNQVMKRYGKNDKSAPARYARAIAHYKMADVDDAVSLMTGLISEQPANPYFHEMMGQILFENSRMLDALPYYQKSHELAPNDPLILLALGRVELELEDPSYLENAIKHFRASLASDPNSAFTWRQLGIAYGRAANMPMSYLALAEEAIRNGNLSGAERLANKALDGLPKGSVGRIRARDVIETVKVRQLQGKK